jgi:uroporphyrin-III C-methyltransferase/precorrin-2 dehydrogenase/sirohydrochlorin ferrochelatase
MAHDTPAFVIERASTAEERVIRGTISDLPEKVARETLTGPVMVLIGWALIEN